MRFFESHVDPDARKRVDAVLASSMLSEGAVVQEFEAAVAERLRVHNVAAVNSGTAALHLALVAAGVGPGDEVVIPPQTFIATGTSVLTCGAKPVFGEIDAETGNLTAAGLAEAVSGKTRAVVPVHWGGHPCDLDGLRTVAADAGIVVIEDAAHAFGASYQGRPIGGDSDFVAFSFQAIKHVTTGDGGCVCTGDSELGARIRRLRWFGMDRIGSSPGLLGERDADIFELGFKYHMNNVAAAIGLANLGSFDARLTRHRAIAARYEAEIEAHTGLRKIVRSANSESAWWFYGLHVDRREDFVRALAGRGVPASVVHRRIDRFSLFEPFRRELPDAASFDATQINLPVHTGLDDAMVERVIEAVAAGW